MRLALRSETSHFFLISVESCTWQYPSGIWQDWQYNSRYFSLSLKLGRMGKYRQAGVLNFNVRHWIAPNKGPKLARPLKCFLFSITAPVINAESINVWVDADCTRSHWRQTPGVKSFTSRSVRGRLCVFWRGNDKHSGFYYESHLFVSAEMWSEKTLKYERRALNLESDPTVPDLIQNLANFGPLCWDGVLTQQLSFSSLVKIKNFIGKITQAWVVWALLSGEALTAHRFKPCWQ